VNEPVDVNSNHTLKKPDPARIADAVDLDTMKKSHVKSVGAGGATTLLEDLVRSGLKNLTVLDYDYVSPTNIYSQGFLCSDIGKPKVNALGEKLKNINPDLNYDGIVGDFLEMSEEEVANFAKDADLLLFMTDNFRAQARGNLVSLKYCKPAIFAIVYSHGVAAEITYNYPGITAGRYRAYANGFQDSIGSSGSTVFSAHLLNSILGFLSLGMLLKDTKKRFGDLIRRIGNRNFIQIRMDPDFTVMEKDVFGKYLGKKNSIFCYDAIWLPPDDPPAYECCPDCHSTGDLMKSNMLIGNTMPIKREYSVRIK